MYHRKVNSRDLTFTHCDGADDLSCIFLAGGCRLADIYVHPNREMLTHHKNSDVSAFCFLELDFRIHLWPDIKNNPKGIAISQAYLDTFSCYN